MKTYETSESARRACDYLMGKPWADGGWGENYKVCHLLRSRWDEAQFFVKLIMSRQLPICGLVSLRVRVTLMRSFQDGSWAQEAIEGIFSRTCAISYPNFKFTFTVWMLGKAHKYLEECGALPL